MKIIVYSDLHLEFNGNFQLPEDLSADILILAGDIISFDNYDPLITLLKNWNKPVLYVPGNHEYYTQKAISEENERFLSWAEKNCSQIHFLIDQEVTINNVHFFGGTMWTDFNSQDKDAMAIAQEKMNDFKLVRFSSDKLLTPGITVELNENFRKKLVDWFEKSIIGTRVVISHHAPIAPLVKYANHPLAFAYHSPNTLQIIEKYQPDLWVYGHTHERNAHLIGKTHLLSNPLGYPVGLSGYECQDFDKRGVVFKLSKI